MKTWSECTFLITGGKQGLGAEFAKTLRALGSRVYVTSSKGNEDSLLWDMQDQEGTKQLLAQITKKSLEIDGLIHCAHVFSEKKLIISVKPEEFQKSLVTNLVPPFELARSLARSMSRRQFGKILFVGSLISQYGGDGKISYITEKAAMDGLMLGFHSEFSRKNIHVNIIHPNIFETSDIFERIPESILQQMLAASLTGKLLQMGDLIQLALPFIDPAQTRSGESVLVDGGIKW